MRPRKSANLTKQGLLAVRSTKVPQEPILVTEGQLQHPGYADGDHYTIGTFLQFIFKEHCTLKA